MSATSASVAINDAAITQAVAAMFPVVYLHRFRMSEDRVAAAELFARHFPDAASPWPLAQPHLRLSIDAVFVGHARLQRSATHGSACGSNLALLRSQIPVLEASAAALGQGWMVALVGQSAAGKTSVVRMLAGMAGARLHEVRLVVNVGRAGWQERTSIYPFTLLCLTALKRR